MRAWFVSCLAAAFCVMLWISPAAASARPEKVNEVSVIGEAVRDVAPDFAYITVGVSARNSKIQAAGAETAARIDGVVKNLMVFGVKKEEIKTANFSVRPVYAPGESQGRIAAYEVENILTIRAGDLNTLGALIDAALSAGANRLGGVQFFASGAAAVRKELLSEAVRDGREKAAIVAQSAGRVLGALLRADVGGAGAPARAAKMHDAMGNFAGSQIFAGAITLTASVDLVFALE